MHEQTLSTNLTRTWIYDIRHEYVWFMILDDIMLGDYAFNAKRTSGSVGPIKLAKIGCNELRNKLMAIQHVLMRVS